MKTELQDKIHDRFEFLQCYIECGDGWFDLIWNLCESIEKELELLNNSEEFMVIQVKEKFGQLRFYSTYKTDKILDLVQDAESKSQLICENCGNTGERRKTTWIFTRCDKCFKCILNTTSI